MSPLVQVEYIGNYSRLGTKKIQWMTGKWNVAAVLNLSKGIIINSSSNPVFSGSASIPGQFYSR